MKNWKPIDTAPAGKDIWTKIDDKDGERNIQKMTRIGNLWYINHGEPNSMYVYYAPTHWAHASE